MKITVMPKIIFNDSRCSSLSFRAYVFTLNNPTNMELLSVANIRYAIWQLERGGGVSNTLHLQGYIEFHTPVTIQAVKICVGEGAHVERRRGLASRHGNIVES